MTPTPFQQAMAEAAMRPLDVQAQLARFERQKRAIEHANQYSMQPSERSVFEGPEPAEPMDFISQLDEHFGSPARSEPVFPSSRAYDEFMAGNKAIADKFEELRQLKDKPLSEDENEDIMERLRDEASNQYMEAVKNAINRRIGLDAVAGEGGITREELPGAYGIPYDARVEVSDKHPLGYRYKRPSVGRATGGAYDEVAENVLGRPRKRFDRYNYQGPLQNENDIAARIAEVNAQQRQQLAQNMGFSDPYDMPSNVYDVFRDRRNAMDAPPTQEELADIVSYLQNPPKPEYTPPPLSEFERFGRPLSDVQTGEPMDLAMRLLKDEDYGEDYVPADYADTFHRVRNNIGADGGYMTDEELNAIDERYWKLLGDGHLNLLEMIEEEQRRRRNHSFEGIRHNEETGFTRSNPMDIAFRMLKERKSPEAMRHKLEYDKQYESSPERVKYRTELNRERRKRGIMGSHDHKDVSHTQGGRLTLESEHDNRARHFKQKGTLREL